MHLETCLQMLLKVNSLGQAIVYLYEDAGLCKGRCLRGAAPNTNKQRLRSGLCERVARREATETEGLVIKKITKINISSPMDYSLNFVS